MVGGKHKDHFYFSHFSLNYQKTVYYVTLVTISLHDHFRSGHHVDARDLYHYKFVVHVNEPWCLEWTFHGEPGLTESVIDYPINYPLLPPAGI